MDETIQIRFVNWMGKLVIYTYSYFGVHTSKHALANAINMMSQFRVDW